MLHMCSFIHNYYFWQYTGIALDNKEHFEQKKITIFHALLQSCLLDASLSDAFQWVPTTYVLVEK